MKQEQPRLTHQDLKEALSSRYNLPFWLLLNEVHDGTGWGWSRSADAVAFGLYLSRGHEVHVFECKASRADFLQEMRKPEKAMIEEADRIFLVIPTGLVKKSEVPANWGLIHVSRKGDGYRLRTTKQAPLLHGDEMWNRPLPKEFVAAMLVRLNKELEKYRKDSVLREDIRGKLDQAYEDGRDSIISCDVSRERERLEFKQLRESVAKFEAKSGISIHSYNGEELGKIVKWIGDIPKVSWMKKRFTFAVKSLRDSANELEEHLEKLPKDTEGLLGFAQKGQDE